MIFRRLANSTVVWSWIYNAFRLTSGIIVLPLVLRQLSEADLGMYYVLLTQLALAPIVDFGFGPTINRYVGYAMGGAKTIEAQGVSRPGDSTAPNYPLLWQLLATTRTLYRYLTLAILVIIGIWGTYNVELRIQETSSLLITRLAWATTLVSTLLDSYFNWWSNFLRGMNEVRSAARIGIAALVVNLVIAVTLLSLGAGLLSLPVATLISAFVQRYFIRRRCLVLLKSPPPAHHSDLNELKKMLGILWPNSWRTGVQLLSGYLTINANTTICIKVFGLAANAKYRLSVQMLLIASSMANVWIMTKWPLIGQYRARHEEGLIQRVFWPRIWLQNLTFFCLAGGVVVCGPYLVRWIGGGKELLPLFWLVLLLLGTFLDLQFSAWGTLISTTNRLPYLWPTVATNVLSLVLSLILVHFTTLGLGALVLGPLLAGCLFNYWYWPFEAARGIGTTLFRFLFLGPAKEATIR
jgi:O-antigen/teichoic acid export membrane protein